MVYSYSPKETRIVKKDVIKAAIHNNKIYSRDLQTRFSLASLLENKPNVNVIKIIPLKKKLLAIIEQESQNKAIYLR